MLFGRLFCREEINKKLSTSKVKYSRLSIFSSKYKRERMDWNENFFGLAMANAMGFGYSHKKGKVKQN